MQLTASTASWLVRQFGTRVQGGVVGFLSGQPGRAFSTRLVEVPLLGFTVTPGGDLVADALGAVDVASSGEIGWAQLTASSGEILATLTVGTPDTDPEADIVLNRLDVQRGAPFALTSLAIRLPR